jgi:hypothetical protein
MRSKTLPLRGAADHMRNRQILMIKNASQSACGLLDVDKSSITVTEGQSNEPARVLPLRFRLEFSSARE